MIADIGTRKGAQIQDIDSNSAWINGYPWMRLSNLDVPVKIYTEMSLDGSDLKSVNEEMLSPVNPCEVDLQSDALLANTLRKSSQSLTAFEWSKDSVVYTEYRALFCKKLVPDEVKSRYKFCNYIINPNKFRLRKVVRVVAFVQRLIQHLFKRVAKGSLMSNSSHTDSQQKIVIPKELKW